ncbi:hypothetical protein [Streptomyces sp. NPDC092903]|uniref:hypothetical protein n=1 Tax=Streptomyces sp. NPDC092903 TaxID=3366017 RepID=UPI00382163D5
MRPAQHRERDADEYGTARLERHRAAATRYGGPAVRCEVTVLLAAINEWLRPVRNSP